MKIFYLLSSDTTIFLIFIISILTVVYLLIGEIKKHTKQLSLTACTIQFIIWCISIVSLKFIIENNISLSKNGLLSDTTISLLCSSLIIIYFIRKSFLMINNLSEMQLKNGRDISTTHIVSRALKTSIFTLTVIFFGEQFGMSMSSILTFSGIGGVAIGMAGKDILNNLLSGIIIYIDRPFTTGDWISSVDQKINGIVDDIGWRTTKIITFENRPVYIPNSLLSNVSIENSGKMTNRRINATISLRYQDADKIDSIVKGIQILLTQDDRVDQSQTLLVYFNNFSESSLDIEVYCFTKTTIWEEWLSIQQDIFIRMIHIVKKYKADFAFPSRTLYLDGQESNIANKQQ